jgi:hypothetical protein
MRHLHLCLWALLDMPTEDDIDTTAAELLADVDLGEI